MTCDMNAMSTGKTAGSSRRRRLRSWLSAGVLVLLAYIAGYFVLMDIHRPTSPYRNANEFFESSFRWAALTRASKDNTGPETPFPEVSIWNIIYRPMDKVYFRLFPRSSNEVERLRAIGYYR